jgi:death-on-curing protein
VRREQIVFVEIEDAELAHRRGLERWGGADGFINRGNLISAVMAPRNGYFTSLSEYAAAYTIGIAQAHAFVDGNKRAAIAAAGMFLAANGHLVALAVDEWEELTLRIAGKHPTIRRPTLAEVAAQFADVMGERGDISDGVA